MSRENTPSTFATLLLVLGAVLIVQTLIVLWFHRAGPSSHPNQILSETNPPTHELEPGTITPETTSTIPLPNDMTPEAEPLSKAIPPLETESTTDSFSTNLSLKIEEEGDSAHAGIAGKIDKRRGKPGDRVNLTVSMRSDRPLSKASVEVSLPEDQVLVGREVSPVGSVRELTQTAGAKNREYEVSFNRPFQSRGYEPILEMELTLSRRIPPGTVVSIPLAGTVTILDEETQESFEGESGGLLVTSNPSDPFPTSTPTPEESNPPTPALTPRGQGQGSPISAEITPVATPIPTLKPTRSISTSPRILTMGAGRAAPGEVASIPMWVDNPNGITGVQLQIEYDSARLEYLGTQLGESFSSFMALTNPSNGIIHVAMTGDAIFPTGGGSTLVGELQFRVGSSLQSGSAFQIRVRGSSIVVESDRVSLLVRHGELSVGEPEPDSSERKSKNENSEGAIDGPPKERDKPNKSPNPPVEVDVHRCDFNFDGSVDSRDLIWLVEWL